MTSDLVRHGKTVWFLCEWFRSIFMQFYNNVFVFEKWKKKKKTEIEMKFSSLSLSVSIKVHDEKTSPFHQGGREDLPLGQEVPLITGDFIMIFHNPVKPPMMWWWSLRCWEQLMLWEPQQSSSLLFWQGDCWVTDCLCAVLALPEQPGRQHSTQGTCGTAVQVWACRPFVGVEEKEVGSSEVCLLSS